MNRYILNSHFLSVFVLLIILIASCNRHKNEGVSVISGNLVSGADPYIRLIRIDTSAYTPIDSVKQHIDGSFSFSFRPEIPGFYLLRSDNKTLVPLVVYPGDSIVAISSQNTTVVSGGAEAGIFDKFRQFLLLDEAVVDSLGTEVMLARDLDNYPEIKKSTDSSWSALMRKAKERSFAYLKEHPDFLSQILVVNSKIQQTYIFDPVIDSNWLYRADSQLARSNINSPHVEAFHKRIKSIREANQLEARARENMKPGKTAPEISLPGVNGRLIALTPSKNRFNLIYIWSPTDGPSRKANLELKMLHEKYKSAGFDVYAVSLDNFKDRWAAAVNLDKLWWTNVNDTLAMNSGIVKDWYVQKLPVLVLVDKQGKIIERFTSVHSLEEYLAAQTGK